LKSTVKAAAEIISNNKFHSVPLVDLDDNFLGKAVIWIGKGLVNISGF